MTTFAKKFLDGVMDHVPSFNDLNAFPEGHHAVDQAADKPVPAVQVDDGSKQAPQPTHTSANDTTPEHHMTNKQDVNVPSMDQLDYLKIDVADHRRDKDALVDSGTGPDGDLSVWEQIQKSQEHVKGTTGPDKAVRIAGDPSGPITSTSAPPGLNPRAVPRDSTAPTAQQVVEDRAADRRAQHAADNTTTQVVQDK